RRTGRPASRSPFGGPWRTPSWPPPRRRWPPRGAPRRTALTDPSAPPRPAAIEHCLRTPPRRGGPPRGAASFRPPRVRTGQQSHPFVHQRVDALNPRAPGGIFVGRDEVQVEDDVAPDERDLRVLGGARDLEVGPSEFAAVLVSAGRQ